MLSITNKRDRNGEFFGSYLGSDGRYYTSEELFDAEGVNRFEFTLVEQSLDDVPSLAASAAQADVENNLNELRQRRNSLLSETDFWSYQDSPDMSQNQKLYRQSLRDITNTYTSLADVVWPTKP